MGMERKAWEFGKGEISGNMEQFGNFEEIVNWDELGVFLPVFKIDFP